MDTTTYRHHADGKSVLGMAGFTDRRFNEAGDHFIAAVQDAIDAREVKGIDDVAMGDGVLSVETAKGTFVLNKQAPMKQLWLSSPLSGPWHYDMKEDASGKVDWINDRNGHRLAVKLSTELNTVTGQKFDFESGRH